MTTPANQKKKDRAAVRSQADAVPPRQRSGEWGAILGLMVVALGARVAAYVLQPELGYDGTYYLRQAQRLAHGHYEIIGFPPGYPLAVWALHIAARDWVLAGRWVSFLCGLASVPLAYVWARHFARRRLALAAAMFLAVQPFAVMTSVEVLTEGLYAMLVLGGLLAYERRRDLVAGIAWGYAYLVRPEVLLILVAYGALRWREHKRIPWRFGIGLVPIVLYAVLASRAVGHPVLSPKQGQLQIDAATASQLWAWLRTLHASFPLLLVPPAWIFGVRHRPRLVIPLLYTLTLPFFAIHIQERLFVPALPFLALLAILWLDALQRRARVALLVVAAAVFLPGILPGYRNLVHGSPLTPHAREIGSRLQAELTFEDRVAGRFPLVSYYAGAGFVRVPRVAAYPVLIDSVLSAGATHLLVLESEMQNILPQLRPLFDDAGFTASDGRLVQVAWVSGPVGARAILYRLDPPPLDPGSVQVVARDIESACWLGTTLVAATGDGRLEIDGRSPEWAAGRRASEPAANGAGTAMAWCVEDGTSRWLVTVEIAGGRASDWPATHADLPSSPTWVGDQVLYVRRADPAGLRVLDPATGGVRDVGFQGLRAGEAVPLSVIARGRDVAVTYVRSGVTGEGRVLATAVWPDPSENGTVELVGRWATQLLLRDDKVAWVPDADLLVASVRIRIVGDDPQVEPDQAALCLVQSGGTIRRLSFGLPDPRRPSLHAGAIAWIEGDGALQRSSVAPADLRIPVVRVFEPAPDRSAAPRR